MAAGLAQAQFLINELSFGYDGTMGKGGYIPNFTLSGQPQDPEVLSNKIILTPPAPGNHRAGVWGEQKLMHNNWIADVDFRASGPERGSGNLNIWLTSGGSRDVGTHSVYSVGRFDGLALVLDSQGGTGMIRGFLNAGNTEYAGRGDVAGLAFGHCQYSYRNLGRPSQIKMRQTASKFSVEVDGRLCFETDKVRVPIGYQFGVTAASADTPDSFEVFKLVVMSETLSPENSYTQQGQADANQRVVGGDDGGAGAKQARGSQGGGGGFFGGKDGDDKDASEDKDPFDVADQSAETYTTSAEQFTDLHNRLQSMTHHISNVFRTVSKHARAGEQQKTEVRGLVDLIKNDVIPRLERVSEVERRVSNLEAELKAMRKDVNQQVKNSERAVQRALGEHHKTLSSTLTDAVPGHGRLIAVIVGSQIVAAVGYYIYKRRRANSPKKYL